MGVWKRFFGILIPVIGLLFIMGNETNAEAKKYYSLQDVGLSGCTTDDVDYTIVSVRGNTIKYIEYQFSEKTQKWKKVKGVQTAKLTSDTKYYMGNSKKVSSSLKKKNTGKNNTTTKNNKKSNSKKTRLTPKVKDINTEKWIYRVRKGIIKKNLLRRNNEIRIVKGKVTKLAVGLTY